MSNRKRVSLQKLRVVLVKNRSEINRYRMIERMREELAQQREKTAAQGVHSGHAEETKEDGARSRNS
jgi:hypothetical protein